MAFRDQCLIAFNADRRLSCDTITACMEDDYIESKNLQYKRTRNLLSRILAHVRGMGHKYIASVLSGIAATL